MRIYFENHAGFQRATLVAAVACSALAGAGTLADLELGGPSAAVLAAAVATLALALCHVRVVVDPIADALAAAGEATDGDGRALLLRAARARETMTRAAARAGAGSAAESRAVTTAGDGAVVALAELLRRRADLAQQIERARLDEDAPELVELEARRDAAPDDGLRETYARAAASLRERRARAHALEGVVERIDARLAAAVAELESTAFAVATRAALAPGDPPAALAAACDRLRGASAELGAECEALAELGTL